MARYCHPLRYLDPQFHQGGSVDMIFCHSGPCPVSVYHENTWPWQLVDACATGMHCTMTAVAAVAGWADPFRPFRGVCRLPLSIGPSLAKFVSSDACCGPDSCKVALPMLRMRSFVGQSVCSDERL